MWFSSGAYLKCDDSILLLKIPFFRYLWYSVRKSHLAASIPDNLLLVCAYMRALDPIHHFRMTELTELAD